ncbi:MAG: ribonuclease R [Gammaproteobacteria bacterium SG8_15]|nr:MAG: ribonuclease R [Gammaproteobacteria bacterium SG8_15]
MSTDFDRAKYVFRNPLWFLRKVLNGFRANQGFLLSGAVAYYTLLSIVPMLALILIVLSQLIDTQQLLETMREYLGLVTPVEASDVAEQIAVVLNNWKLFGVVGLVILLFFSSLAFTMLENAMSVIFFHRVIVRRRHFLISAIIPYCYIFFLALGLLVVSMVSGTIHSLDDKTFLLLGHEWSLSGFTAGLVYFFGIVGEILLLTSLYLVMPTGRLALSHALIGGVTATFLWEITRHFLVWYFATLSVVNVVYGTFATAIIILLSLEAAAIILLLGAQVISEYERIGNEQFSQQDLQT